MNKLRIYIDTSVINFLFAEDVPDFRKEERFMAINKDMGYSYPLRIVSPMEVAYG